jgi:hypothetical protein
MDEDELERIAAGMHTVNGVTVFDDDTYAQEYVFVRELCSHEECEYRRKSQLDSWLNEISDQ